MEVRSIVSSKGQVVVPKKVRDYLELNEGDMLQFTIRESGEVVVSPIRSENPLELFGTLPPKAGNTEHFNQVLYEAKAEKALKHKQGGKD